MHKILAHIFKPKDGEDPFENDDDVDNSTAQNDAAMSKKRTKTKLANLISSDEPPHPWSLEKYYKVSKKILGRGSFSVVKRCTDKRTGVDYALKIILKKSIQGKEQMLTTELDVLKKVDHPNLITLHDLFETKDAVYIITGLALGGELYGQLLQRGSYTEKDAAILIEQILRGVEYLHEHEIVHRDLKPENLLFSDKSPSPRLMIVDFGLSKILKHHDDILTTACGTPGYVAPEILKQTGYGKSVDIWSVGVILYTVLCGYTPFWGEDQNSLFDSILKGVYNFDEEYWADISDEAKNLIDKMLMYNPTQRITARDALAHPWFEYAANMPDVDWSSTPSSPISPQFPLPNMKARTTLKKAINVIQGVTRMQKLSQFSTIGATEEEGAGVGVYQGENSMDIYTAGMMIDDDHGEGTSGSAGGNGSRNNKNVNMQTLGSSGVLGFKVALGTLDEDSIIDSYMYNNNNSIFDENINYSGNNNYLVDMNNNRSRINVGRVSVTESVWSSSSESSGSIGSEMSSSISTIRGISSASTIRGVNSMVTIKPTTSRSIPTSINTTSSKSIPTSINTSVYHYIPSLDSTTNLVYST